MLGKMPHEITHKSTVRALGFIRIMWRGMIYCVWHSGPSRRGWEGQKPFESYESEGLGVHTQDAGLVLKVVCVPEDI